MGQAILNAVKVLFLFVLLVTLLAAMGGPTWFLGDAAILYRYTVQNRSGEPVVCAVIGWFPRAGTDTVAWQPAPNVKGPGYGIALNPWESAEIALTTSDFSALQILVRGRNATETRTTGKPVGYGIPPLSECPLASEALLPCFDGYTVTLPYR